MAVDRTENTKKPYSLQHIWNMGFDPEMQVPVVEMLAYDPSGAVKRVTTGDLATKITTAGSITYLASAAPGTAESEAAWQVQKIEEGADTVITWADGDTEFDNVATDLTALSYS